MGKNQTTCNINIFNHFLKLLCVISISKCQKNEHVHSDFSTQRKHSLLYIKNSAFIYVILWKNNYIPFLKNIEDNEIKK